MISPDRKAFVLRLPAQDHSRLKARALEEGQSMNELICSLVHSYLSGQPAKRRTPAPMERSFHPVGCPHDEVEKRTTPALGTRRFCKDCGALLP